MKRHAMGALAALLILTLTACSRPLTGGMGIALPGGNSGWAAAVTHEAQAWAQSLEAPHQLVTAKEAVTQEKQLLQLAAQGASVIVWSPVEDQPMPDSLAQGKTAVVTFRRSAPTAGDALLTQDPAALGAMQAQTLAALLGETGRTACLAGQEDAAWQEAFALEAANHPGVVLAATQPLSSLDREAAKAAAAELLAADDSLDALYCPDGQTAWGAWEACQEARRTGVRVIAVAGNAAGHTYVLQGNRMEISSPLNEADTIALCLEAAETLLQTQS